MLNSLMTVVDAVLLQIDKMMVKARAKRADQALSVLPDHTLKDIGIVRHAIDY